LPLAKKSETIADEEADIEQFRKTFKRLKSPVMVVAEATGGYEILLIRSLIKNEISAAVVNPRQVRDFAKGIGMDAKTDLIDAQVISRFAEVVKPSPVAMTSDHEQKHSALVARRSQLSQLINRGEVAKLVGVAPIHRDSGTKTGKRMKSGGRGYVRRVLYMATFSAVRSNPAIRAFYQHLKSRGKESKVALVACMRKLITLLNLLIKTDQMWQTK